MKSMNEVFILNSNIKRPQNRAPHVPIFGDVMMVIVNRSNSRPTNYACLNICMGRTVSQASSLRIHGKLQLPGRCCGAINRQMSMKSCMHIQMLTCILISSAVLSIEFYAYIIFSRDIIVIQLCT